MKSYLSVLLAKLVQDVGGVEAGVVAQLTRDDLRSKGSKVSYRNYPIVTDDLLVSS